MVPGSNSSGSSGGGGDGEGDGDNDVYNPSSADNNHGKEEQEEEEDMQHGDKLGGECRVVTMADKEPDEGEPPDNNNEPVPEKSNEPVDVRNESIISSKTTSDFRVSVDVFGDYLLLEKLIRE